MARNIVICLDGTWDTLSTDPENLTNVHFLSVVAGYRPDVPGMKDQECYYDDGVGAGPLIFDRYLNGALGKGVFTQARRAWDHIRRNNRAGDRIFIFGFSRGAFAARHLASMLTHCGIGRSVGQETESDFRKWLTVAGTPVAHPKAEVEFLGLFDCVPANQILLALNRKYQLNSPDLENGIKHVRHALARDERRWSFKPLVFRQNADHETFQQVIFPGFHRDVGGGGKSNEGLARIPLWWMMREAYGVGLDFNIVSCRLHRAGNNTFIGDLDPSSKSQCSDYLTTRLGIKHMRNRDPDFAALSIAPELLEMDICPRCEKEMFDVLATPKYRQRTAEILGKSQIF